MPDSAVEVTDLIKRYPSGRGASMTAVDGVSLRAAKGEITALLGPNGAGKTSTVEICCGLRDKDGGDVRVLDHRPGHDRVRASVGVMLQSGSTSGVGVAGTTKVSEALTLTASYYANPLPITPLIEQLGLGQVAKTPWRRLSGGEQQRLCFALAIVGRPELVFLDEPTSGLDVQGRLAMIALISDLRRAGVAVVLTTHQLNDAESLADHVVIVDHGRVVAAGSTTELTGTSQTNETVSFDATVGLDLPGLIAALPTGADGQETAPGSYRLTGVVDARYLAAVTGWCAEQGVMPRNLKTGERSLEDVFLDLTGRELRS